MSETPKYNVFKQDDNVELRQYPGYIKAEVEIEKGSYRNAIFKGFQILAEYIFGNNINDKKIAMTSPVQVTGGTKIAMTKPVTISGEGTYTVAFIMPSEYSMDTLPEPKNTAIRFSSVKPKTMAVIKFSGFYRKRQVEKAKKRLKNWLNKRNFAMRGDFIVAGYNPPWVPWFLARNEVMVEVELENK